MDGLGRLDGEGVDRWVWERNATIISFFLRS